MRRFFPLGVGVWWLVIPAVLRGPGAVEGLPGRGRAIVPWNANIRRPSRRSPRPMRPRRPKISAGSSRPASPIRLSSPAGSWSSPGRSRADRSSFDALSWVLAHHPQGPEGEQALELLAASHLDDPRLGPVLQHLGSSKSPAAMALVCAALEKSQDREVQAHACYALISMLTAREHHARAGQASNPHGQEARTGGGSGEEGEG